MKFIIEEDDIIRKGIIILSWDEVAEIIAMKKVFYKLIDKAIFSYQMWLGMWQYRDNEKSVYSKIDWFQELKKDIEKLESTLVEYNEKQAEK